MTGQGGDTVHGTCVTFGDIGLLLRGEAGSGKSDLALRLIESGAMLVADDRVALVRDGDHVVVSPPSAISGLLEIRGLGIVQVPHAAAARLGLVVDLVPTGSPERLPQQAWCEYLGCRVKHMKVAPFEHSAVAKLRIAAYMAVGQRDPGIGAMPHLKDEE